MKSRRECVTRLLYALMQGFQGHNLSSQDVALGTPPPPHVLEVWKRAHALEVIQSCS